MDSNSAREEPIESVLNELRVRVETRRISVRGLANFSEPSRDTSRHGRPPSPLVRAQRAKITGEDRLGVTHLTLHLAGLRCCPTPAVTGRRSRSAEAGCWSERHHGKVSP